MNDRTVLYCALRIFVDNLEKFIMLTWVGSGVGYLRGFVSMHKQAVRYGVLSLFLVLLCKSLC